MTDWLIDRIHASPNATALLIGDQRWSYASLGELVNGLTAWLADQPRPENGRWGLLMQNGLTYVCFVHAAARLGVTLVTLNTRLTPAELSWQLNHTKCELLFTDNFMSNTGAATIDTLLGEYGRPCTHTITPEVENIHPNPQVDTTKPIPNDLHRVQAIAFTSGTTGRPKAVPLTFANHLYSAMGSAYRLGHSKEDMWLSCLPLYHVGGLAVIFRSTLYGIAVDLHPRFNLDAIHHSLDTKPITLASFVPTMLVRLLNGRSEWPSSMRMVLLGGAATPPELVKRCAAENLPIAVTYGMTEASSQIATMLPDQVNAKPGSAGRPLLFTRVKITTEDGTPAAPNQVGELWVSGPIVTSGYLDNPAANAERFQDGWFSSGDIGYLDDDGDLWIVQRRSDLIVTGGENVYPSEVEAALRQHPAVHEACIVGLPDNEWGQMVAAMIELRPQKTASTEELIAFARQRLAGYKIPRIFHFVDQLPQTASGKIARKQVKDQINRQI